MTAAYVWKRGDSILERELPLVEKRVYIRGRQEPHWGPTLFEEVRVAAPELEDDAKR